jgi:transposase
VPLLNKVEAWMRVERGRLSRHADVAKAFNYMLTPWPAFTDFPCDGQIWLTNNAVARALRGIALGRKALLFASSHHGGECAAVLYGLNATAKLNDVDHPVWLADVLARMADQPIRRLGELMPWHRHKTSASHATAAS